MPETRDEHSTDEWIRVGTLEELKARGMISVEGAYSADDRLKVRLLVKPPLSPHVFGLRSIIVVSLVALALSTAIWGAVYLLNVR